MVPVAEGWTGLTEGDSGSVANSERAVDSGRGSGRVGDEGDGVPCGDSERMPSSSVQSESSASAGIGASTTSFGPPSVYTKIL